jgi:preprotein translocase subunit SecG
MYTLVVVIHVIACLILITTILFQSGRGGGLSGLFGGGTSQTIFGARASTFLIRATTVAAVMFLLTCITLTIFSSRKARSLMTGAGEAEVVEEALPEVPAEEVPEETEETKSEVSETQPQESEESKD